MSSDETSPLARELAAYEKLKKKLEKHHMGKWVLVHEGKLVGTYDTLDTTAKEAVRQFGRGPYLIRQVGQDEALRLPASVIYPHAHATR